MEQIFSAFGIDAKLIVIQIVNFGLLLVALWYFLYTPVLRILEERQEKIKKGVEDAEAAERSLQEAENKKEAIIADAHHESQEIVKKAERTAESTKESLIEEADAKASTIVQNAEKQANETRDRMKAESEREIAEAAVLAAERVLRDRK